MKMQVRHATAGDKAGVLAIERELLNPWDAQDHRDFLRHECNATFVAACDGVVYGFVCATVMPKVVTVERLAVANGARRHRIGTELLNSLELWFSTPSGTAGDAVVCEYDVGTQLFLKACGWECVKTVRWGDVSDEYLFKKRFTQGEGG